MKISVNGVDFTHDADWVSYEQIVALAGLAPGGAYAVVYSLGGNSGSMVPGGPNVVVSDGTAFTVVHNAAAP